MPLYLINQQKGTHYLYLTKL